MERVAGIAASRLLRHRRRVLLLLLAGEPTIGIAKAMRVTGADLTRHIAQDHLRFHLIAGIVQRQSGTPPQPAFKKANSG